MFADTKIYAAINNATIRIAFKKRLADFVNGVMNDKLNFMQMHTDWKCKT
jgi:hypothetical protein